MSKKAKRRAGTSAPAALQVRHHATIAPGQDGDALVACSIGPAHELVALWATPGPRQGPTAARVTVQTPHSHHVVHLAAVALDYPLVQTLPGGRVLVVAMRTDGTEHNATIFDADGVAVASATLGDGIGHVLTTRSGQVWVGYFDEGVYGGGSLAAHGLARFSGSLRPVWQHPFDSEWGVIDDCYALNVDGETAWACYYSDFPIVRVQADAVSGWRNDVRGAAALAVAGSRVALFGGYEPGHDRLAVGDLVDGRLQVTDRYRLVLPDGSPPAAETRVVGRGAELHFLTDRDWYRLSLSDLR